MSFGKYVGHDEGKGMYGRWFTSVLLCSASEW
jgi:hypothetical protein